MEVGVVMVILLLETRMEGVKRLVPQETQETLRTLFKDSFLLELGVDRIQCPLPQGTNGRLRALRRTSLLLELGMDRIQRPVPQGTHGRLQTLVRTSLQLEVGMDGVQRPVPQGAQRGLRAQTEVGRDGYKLPEPQGVHGGPQTIIRSTSVAAMFWDTMSTRKDLQFSSKTTIHKSFLDRYRLSYSSHRTDLRVPSPNREVTDKENMNTTSVGGSYAKSSFQHLNLPLRPSHGKLIGPEQVILRTNYFDVKISSLKELFKYKVAIRPLSTQMPALKNGRKRRQLYKILFRELDFQDLGQGFATDYAETLITCGKLYKKSLQDKKYELIYRNEQEDSREVTEEPSSDERKYEVIVTCSGMVPSSELLSYINSRPTDPSDFDARSETIQAMNIIVAGSPNKNDDVFQAGPNKFFQYPRGSPDRQFSPVYDSRDLGCGLIAIRGYFSSIRTSTSRILLNLNAQCSAFYPEMNLLDLMYRFVGGSEIPKIKYPDLEQFIRKLRVTTEQLTREGKTVTREKTVWGFSHKHERVDIKGRLMNNKDGSPKMRGTKGADHDYGSSNSIRFLCDTYTPPKLMSVSEYFFKREPFPYLGKTEAYTTPRLRATAKVSEGISRQLWYV